MGIGGIKIFCRVDGQINEGDGIDWLSVSFDYTPPIQWQGETGGLISSGWVRVDVTGLTETEINAKNQEAVLLHANDEAFQAGHGVVFTLADIRGGRI